MRSFNFGFSLGLLISSSCITALPTDVESLDKRQADDSHWVATWTSMPQLVEPANLPPSPFQGGAVFKDATLRQTLHVSIGAERIRFQISNTFGGSDLPITAASVSLPTGGKAGVNSIDTTTLKGLTFNGSASVIVPRGQVVYTDAVDFKIQPQSMITVDLYSQDGQPGSSITGHPGSRTTSWMQQGNHLNASTVTGANTKHWYFLTAVEAWAPKTTSALVILGDSITDGRGSTDDANNRWPDLVLANMQKAGLTTIGVNNQAAGGNTVLAGGLGPPLMQRYKRDALEVAGVKYVLIFEGVNDIGGGGTDSGSQQRIGDQLISSFKQIASDAHKTGLLVFGATITPFGGNGQSYSNPTRDATRQRVNTWILGGGEGSFDGTVDFAKTVADGTNAANLASRYDGGDHLHPNVAGYQAMADTFPLALLRGNASTTA
ncbi:SGNH hydrolase-type esterase domain-containing protein [Pseudomassariella vexata]|uniref:SGNH hydrolase-type esterase domain-containing protein n=1 Tax=Pseudomassariella vexata TaxID=1141098 RepID=A0A1Y2DQJ6_9PEZI|nr:SGNH hydrolase-type esterase domain-containing protein [Pseudomassariella vexata]ORY61563.1 SGNH hydrolase-type esterase domain-containing protein [Pseudomassariella vexata]